jgi:hypothetical protein
MPCVATASASAAGRSRSACGGCGVLLGLAEHLSGAGAATRLATLPEIEALQPGAMPTGGPGDVAPGIRGQQIAVVVGLARRRPVAYRPGCLPAPTGCATAPSHRVANRPPKGSTD